LSADEVCITLYQVDKEQADKIMSYIASGKDQGAKLVAGGNRAGDKGFYIEPTVFADVQDEMKIAQEEVYYRGGN
jgi:aldehyde dehydrogenase (NAD+)